MLARAISCAASILVCLCLGSVGTMLWSHERLLDRVRSGDVDVPSIVATRWADGAARMAALQILDRGASGHDGEATKLLAHALSARPLHAPNWLDRARAARREGVRELAGAQVDLSEVLWPERRHHLWRLAVERVEVGDSEGTFRALRGLLRADSERTLDVLALAALVEGPPERRIERLLVAGEFEPETADRILERVLKIGCHGTEHSLVDSAWRRLSDVARSDRRIASLYTGCLVARRDSAGVQEVWSPHAPEGGSELGITNPGFEEPPLQSGLGWRIGKPPGVRWARDSLVRHGGTFSLMVDFDGSESREYQHAGQVLLVTPGRSYRVRGYWRGERLEPWPGARLEVVSQTPGRPLHARSEPGVGTWDWRRFELEFETDAETRFVALRLRRRRPAREVDRLSGRIWIDDVQLEPIRGLRAGL